jgi:glycosyltransferase involved in cell wall biosynthesis
MKENCSRLYLFLFSANYGRVGDALRAFYTGRALAKRGHRVTVFYPSAERRLGFHCYMEDGVQVVEAPHWHGLYARNRYRRLWVILPTLYWLARHPYDVYHAFVPVENVALPWLLWQRLNPDAVYIFDQSDLIVDGGFLGNLEDKRGLDRLFYQLTQWTEKTVKKQADANFVCSRRLAQRAVEQGASPEHVHLFRAGPMIKQVFPLVDKNSARQQLGLDSTKLILGFASHHLAGLEELLSALEILSKRQCDFQLIFTGAKSADLERRIRSTSLQNNITLTGWLEDKKFWLYLSACDMVLAPLEDSLPHRYNFPGKLLNYMAVGRPIVIGDVGDSGQFVRSKGVGVAYEGGAVGLADAIVHLASDSDSARVMGLRGRELIETDLSWSSITAQMENIYYSLWHEKHMEDKKNR